MAATFIHKLGSLIYFEDDKLCDLVILDPQWLTDLMSTIITTKHNYIGREGCEGILRHSVLPFLWRPPVFPEYLHGFILNLLNRFEIAFTLDSNDINLEQNLSLSSCPTNSVNGSMISEEDSKKTTTCHKPADTGETGAFDQPQPSAWHGSVTPLTAKQKEGCSLIPSLLPTKRPDASLMALWPARREDDQISEFGRIYRFSFVPAGFFGRVMVRLLGFKLSQILLYWRNGLLLANGQQRVFVELKPEENILSVTIRTAPANTVLEVSLYSRLPLNAHQIY